MILQQVTVVLLCVFLASQSTFAVVNNNVNSATSSDSTTKTSASNTNVNNQDSVAEGSDTESNRREIPAAGLSDSYGVPIPSNSYGPPDSYIPSIQSNPGLPVPLYGVPNGPGNNIIYPAPPPDIPPALPSFPALSGAYGPPKPVYGPPIKSHFHGPLPSFKQPHFHKPSFGHSVFHKSPRPSYGPPPPSFIPKPQYGPPKPIYGPPKLPKPSYGPPLKLNYLPPKPLFHPTKLAHGPIRVNANFGTPLATYGPPHHLGPLFSPPKDTIGPIKNLHSHGNPVQVYGPPAQVYGPPSPAYGPPEPIPHGPPHPGAPAPPTPPDIKYDGWQPIPGLVSRPPSGSYGIPQQEHGGGLDLNAPPLQTDVSLTYASSFAHGSGGSIGGGFGNGHIGTNGDGFGFGQFGSNGGGFESGHIGSNGGGFESGHIGSNGGGFESGHIGSNGGEFINRPSDSYGAPLNSVTGSGGVVSSSINNHNHGSSDGSFGNVFGGSFVGNDNSLSVIKSIGYEIFPSGSQGLNYDAGINNGGHQISSAPTDSYGAPPADSFSPNGPYPAAHKHKGLFTASNTYKNTGPNFAGLVGGHSHGQSQGLSLSSTGIGLIPPSGLYGVPPSSQYGTPLLSPPSDLFTPSGSYGSPLSLNALHINPPKSPVVFREPVPAGLIESIGESVAHKDAHGIEHSQTSFQGQAYIPPPIPDLTKQKEFNGGNLGPISPPSDLYSLPNTGNPVSFQSVVHGSGSSNDIGHGFSNSFNVGNDRGRDITLTSYTAPLGAIDSSYGIPLKPQALTANFAQSQGLDFSGVNFGSTYSVPLQYAVPHDCSQHKSQILSPQQSYNLPTGSASSYAASISSLNTNIGSQSNYQLPNIGFGNSDLQYAQNLPTSQQNFQSNSLEINGKSLGQEYFEKGSNLQKSHEIHVPNGVQNIPLQGALGSYTLQIQSANGAGGPNEPVENVPHEQVLSEGLLQSILAAIEQPQQQDRQLHHQQHQLHQQQQFDQQQQQFDQQQQQFDQQQQQFDRHQLHHQHQQQQFQQEQQFQQQQQQNYADLQHSPSGSVASYQQSFSNADGEAQHSVARQVVVNPAEQESPTTPNSIENLPTPTSLLESDQQPIRLIDNNEIMLYFNNNNNEQQDIRQQQQQQQQDTQVQSSDTVKQDDESDVRNGQQYGSFVSFRGPHSSYVYGELKTSNDTQIATPSTENPK